MLMKVAVVMTWVLAVVAFAQADTVKQPSEYLSHERPSDQYQLAQYKDVRFMYPLNWLVKTSNTGWMLMGPKFGFFNNAVVCGVTMGSFVTQESFENASVRFLDLMRHETVGGLNEREPQANITVGGKQGKRWSFQATSLLQVRDKRERDDLILVPLSKERIWWVVFTSLQQDDDFLQPVFSKMVQTIQFNDRTDDLRKLTQDMTFTLSTPINTDTSHSGDPIQAEIHNAGNEPRRINGYILEIPTNKEKNHSDRKTFFDNLRSSSSSSWVTVNLVGVRNSKGQRGVDDSGAGIS